MGNYNPHQPYILGEEWVPIRDRDAVFSPAVNSVELGHGFTLATSRQITNARFYINDLRTASDRGQTFMAAVYASGTEDQSGPVSSLLVPCNACTVTNGTVSGAATAIEALLTQSTSSGISLDCSQPNAGLAMNFAMSSYPVLNGKRILGLNFLIGVSASDDIVGPTRTVNTSQILMTTTATIGSTTNPRALFGRLTDNLVIDRKPTGEINQFWTANSPATIADRLPWTYAQLVRLDATATQLFMRLDTGTNRGTTANSTCYVYYVAFEVIYCEEKRLAVGATQFGTTFASASFGAESVLGANQIVMHDTAGNLTPVLAAGNYVLTLASADVGNLNDSQSQNTSDYPDLNAVLELYQIPPHPGVELDLPFPLIERIGDVFTSKVTHTLPQLSLHASGGTLTEPHVYGRQVAAQVYGVNTATQEIYDDISGVAATYPQVRYYARRFGDTTIPLTLTGVGVLAGSTASITVADFDALTEILDGWKEITLRFATPPSMGAVAGNPGWTWSATSETSGNRWEILGASAPAVSGIGGNLYNQVPTADRLGTATYQPPAGDTVELTWMPQGVSTPWVTGATADAGSDAVLIFSQDPPTVTGLALSQLTQPVSGIGALCGSTPCCIPTGIGYHQVSWSAQTALPVSGFGAYELQRWDAVTGGDFATIMLSTTASGTSFRDYEARVGVTAVYRIRTLNVLNFAGSWSTYVSGAPPAPGVTGGCGSQDGVLIFTSNSDQTGADNAAYVMQWDNTPNESFDLPESDMVTFQPMYGRDGSIAFHGTERGLEEFSRQVLLQAGAIALPSLADAADIRDLAWAQLPYICVRDDRGNRWFSNVRVNGVNARNNAQNYMASLAVTETTRTAYPVDP
jgi:hypothetical protein